MDFCTLKFKLAATNRPLSVVARFDQEIIWQGQISDPLTLSHPFTDEDDAQHSLSIVMSEKTHEHTKLGFDGEIIEDSCITVSDFMFDDIEVDQAFYENCVYTHDRNGTGDSVQESFYGTMGCNGTVTFSFSSPTYLWLLETL